MAQPANTAPRPTADAATTLAVVQHRYGSPDVLTLRHVPKPTPGPGEVLVTVKAASLNARDWHAMRGEPRLARLIDLTTFGLRWPRVAIRGTDVAGVVEAVTFIIDKIPAQRIQQHLSAHGVNVSVSVVDHARLDFPHRRLPELVRASVHYYNTEDELDRLISALPRI